MDDSPVVNLNLNPHHQRYYYHDLSDHLQSGYPISNPEPEVGVDGKPVARIEIGDVGYISPLGKFVRLFNVHLEPGVNGQPALIDLPEGFVPTPPKPNMIHLTSRNTPMFAHIPWVSERWGEKVLRQLRGHRTASSDKIGPGAILATPQITNANGYLMPGIRSEDALNTIHYVKHAQQNAKSWHEFASRRLGLELDDLIFVTGVDRAAMWATAVHDGKKVQALDFGPKASYPDEEALNEAESYWKEYLQSLLDRCNETLRRSGKHRRGEKDDADEKYEMEQRRLLEKRECLRGLDYDQAVFLRYVRAKRRDQQGVTPTVHHQSIAGTSSEYLLEKNDYFVGSSGRERLTKALQFTDYLEPALDYILKYSDADTAVAHSRQLYRLPGSFWEKCLDAWLMVEDGVGVLSTERTPGARRLSIAQVLLDLFGVA
ncbi:hypothetical protein PENSPDRAFT_670895 [Peniophora sp. CONT]|nr:hypothetical protein PENSPDRAFT_670895 [Peniophora sp. CONT]